MIGPEGGGAEGIRRGDTRGREEGDAGEEGKAAADPPLLNHFVLLHLLLRCSSSHFTFSSSAFPSFTSTSCFFFLLSRFISFSMEEEEMENGEMEEEEKDKQEEEERKGRSICPRS